MIAVAVATMPDPPPALAINPVLHQLVFAHWDWSAPGAGEVPRAALYRRGPRRPASGYRLEQLDRTMY